MEIYSFINTLKKYGFSCRCGHLINNRMRFGFNIETRALGQREKRKRITTTKEQRYKKEFSL